MHPGFFPQAGWDLSNDRSRPCLPCCHIHRVTTRKPGSYAYGIAYGRP